MKFAEFPDATINLEKVNYFYVKMFKKPVIVAAFDHNIVELASVDTYEIAYDILAEVLGDDYSPMPDLD